MRKHLKMHEVDKGATLLWKDVHSFNRAKWGKSTSNFFFTDIRVHVTKPKIARRWHFRIRFVCHSIRFTPTNSQRLATQILPCHPAIATPSILKRVKSYETTIFVCKHFNFANGCEGCKCSVEFFLSDGRGDVPYPDCCRWRISLVVIESRIVLKRIYKVSSGSKE